MGVIVQRLAETTSPNGVLPFGSLWGAGAFTPGEGKNQSAFPTWYTQNSARRTSEKWIMTPILRKTYRLNKLSVYPFLAGVEILGAKLQGPAVEVSLGAYRLAVPREHVRGACCVPDTKSQPVSRTCPMSLYLCRGSVASDGH